MVWNPETNLLHENIFNISVANEDLNSVANAALIEQKESLRFQALLTW